MMMPLRASRDEIRRLHSSGLSINQIAERLGCARSTVWRAINGHKPASGARAKKVDREKLLELWQQGLTLLQIGLQLGCSASTVGMLVRQHAIPPREQLRKMPLADPTPEEIEQRASECRERHYAERRREAACNTHSKVSMWRKDIVQPRGFA
jgi:DNA-binding CsgD family transcriptional regulator